MTLYGRVFLFAVAALAFMAAEEELGLFRLYLGRCRVWRPRVDFSIAAHGSVFIYP